jgi:hypothetical protein
MDKMMAVPPQEAIVSTIVLVIKARGMDTETITIQDIEKLLTEANFGPEYLPYCYIIYRIVTGKYLLSLEETKNAQQIFERKLAENKNVPLITIINEALKDIVLPKEPALVTRTKLEDVECCICLEDVEFVEQQHTLPCKHNAFHTTCIQKWTLLHSTCPLCRGDVDRE